MRLLYALINGRGNGTRTHTHKVSEPKSDVSANSIHTPVWSRRRGLNSQHPAWKTGTLPVELRLHIWCLLTDSNRRPLACRANALPAELNKHIAVSSYSTVRHCVIASLCPEVPTALLKNCKKSCSQYARFHFHYGLSSNHLVCGRAWSRHGELNPDFRRDSPV